MAVPRDRIGRYEITGTLGEVISGKVPARPGDAATTITIFDSTGLAIQDVALARRLYETALSRGIGTPIPLV